MKKNLIISILLLIANISFAQYTVTISSNKGIDTAHTCEDTVTTKFYAQVKFNNTIITGSHFKWDFGDGVTEDGTDLDTVTHKYPKDGGGYRVKVVATKSITKADYKSYDIMPVLVGLKPYFTDTKSNIADDKGICNGDEAFLTGKVASHEWKDEINNVQTELFEQYLNENSYTGNIERKDFIVGDKITDPIAIDSIGIKIEHSNTANLQVKITCPEGNEVILKEIGGVDKYLGEPIDEEGTYDSGIGYWYYWTNSPENGTMSSSTMYETTLPSGTYEPTETLDGLNGCSYNGEWTITVIDEESTDNGYVFAWSLYFDESVRPDTLKFENTYLSSFWNTDPDEEDDEISGTNQTDYTATATPDGDGGHDFIFTIQDDYGCEHDTTINVLVEKPDFTLEPVSLVIGDSIQVTDNTTWATEWNFNFDDKSDNLTDSTGYHKFEEEGKYTVLMTVKSKTGCEAEDTATVDVTFRPVELQEYNVFTPNGDGINDVFTFFNKPDDKITAANIRKINGRIINRHGNVVCVWRTVEDAIDGWDGTINNGGKRLAPPGFYYYVIRITGKDENKLEEPISGFIYLYRGKN